MTTPAGTNPSQTQRSYLPPELQVRDSTLAIVSMVTGIVGWLLLPLIGAITAIVTGHLANKEIKESNGMLTGKGMATTGLILGYIQIAFIVLAVIAIILVLLFVPATSNWFANTAL